MYHYEHTQPSTFVRVTVGGCVLVLGVSGAVQMARSGEGAILIVGIAVFMAIILLLFHSLTVRLTEDEIQLRFGVGAVRKSFLIKDIEDATATRSRWFYGWDIKMIAGGWLYNVSGFDVVEIRLRNGTRAMIGTDEPQQLLLAVENALDRLSSTG